LFEGGIAATTSSIGPGVGAGIDLLTTGGLGFGATLVFGLTALANPGFAAAFAFATGFAASGFGATVLATIGFAAVSLGSAGLAATGFKAFASFDSSSVTFASAFTSFCFVFDSFAFNFFFFIT
jgi:hypothetical protein